MFKDSGIIEMRADHTEIIERIEDILKEEFDDVFHEELGDSGLVAIYYS